jgi:ectoine hydroxylase-related dioxygenase (phytanoyl-CoA dioxygenase family)
MLSREQLRRYETAGHLTVDGVFDAAVIDATVNDAETWAQAEISSMTAEDEFWYLDRGVSDRKVLRKLDNPVALRKPFRELAHDPALTSLVRQLIGDDLKVLFSQIFFKPPGGGGPKPVHQDNFYFGPNDPDGMVTAWIALDDADVENGCLYYGEASHLDGIIEHVAPADRPYDLLVPSEVAAKVKMRPAPVKKGGVSFHHGTTLHQSSDNKSDRWRRACAIHYANGSTVLQSPALPYDDSMFVTVG